MFEIKNKNEALKLAQLIGAFIMIDVFLTKCLPLLTKVSIMTFALLEFDFKVVETSFNASQNSSRSIVSHRHKRTYQRRDVHEQKWTIFHGVLVLAIVFLDIYLAGIYRMEMTTMLRYFGMLLLLMINTILIL